MMKIFLTILLCYSALSVLSQSSIKIFAEKENGKTILYIQNHEVTLVSVLLELNLVNMSAIESIDHIYIIPSNTDKFKIAELSRIEKGKTSYHYTFKVVFGNVKQVDFDRTYRYDLPFEKGSAYRVIQGYNGLFTHQKQNALDFDMPSGTPIIAARSGTVIAVVQQFNESCMREECRKMANYVLICHSDGTIADYSHIQYNGATVAVGDSVTKGDLIAFSGNTGYTRGPHLHFICFLPDFENRRGVVTKFRTGNGKIATYLSEHTLYKKKY